MGKQTRVEMLSILILLLVGCAGADRTSRTEPFQSSPSPITGDNAPRLPTPLSPANTLLASAEPPTGTPFTAPEQTQNSSSDLPALLTQDAIANCPVSLPNLTESPDEYYISSRSGYGNAAGTMFIGLWPGGVVTFHPNGPGHESQEGLLGVKFWFYRTIPGEVVFEGRRQDAPAPPMPETILRGPADGYGETGFHPSELVFPGEGCWEVTARIGEESLTFVTLVVKVPFEPIWPKWLPEGLFIADQDATNSPESLVLIFRPEDGREGGVSIETGRGLGNQHASYPEDSQQQVAVQGQPGTCVSGAWDEQGQWQAGADAGALEWAVEGLSYRISHMELGLGCEDLLRIAGE